MELIKPVVEDVTNLDEQQQAIENRISQVGVKSYNWSFIQSD